MLEKLRHSSDKAHKTICPVAAILVNSFTLDRRQQRKSTDENRTTRPATVCAYTSELWREVEGLQEGVEVASGSQVAQPAQTSLVARCRGSLEVSPRVSRALVPT